MGRYYNGDINGKFWFAIQDSCDADFFGVQGEFPQDCLSYHFTEENLKDIKNGISECKKTLNKNKERLDQFFEVNNGFNDQMIIKYFKENFNQDLNEDDVRTMLSWYARLELGEKIFKCVVRTGQCSFDAEC